jgi:hypothetical protein
LLCAAGGANAGPREQAKRIHDRLAGVPPSAAVLDTMADKIAAGSGVDAAFEAMKNPAFYNTTLKNFVTPWTNESANVFAELNDYTATVIGMVRDDVPFNEVLTGDILYVGAAGTTSVAYSQVDNDHYVELEAKRLDLSDSSKFVRSTQSSQVDAPVDPDTAAGIITTRAFGKAFFRAGTNRRALRFIAVNYLCNDLEPLLDITRPADRVRQDVSRSPGGESRQFLNNCVGCHAGMDGLAGAFAYYDYVHDMDEDPEGNAGHLGYNRNGMVDAATGSRVQAKNVINANSFPGGYVTTDDSWINYWRGGPNAVLGWRGGAGQGNGAKSLGAEIAASRGFSQCQVQKVFQQVCLRAPSSPQDRSEVDRIATVFETSSYSMKRVFAEVADFCKGP